MDDIDRVRTELKQLGNQHRKWLETAPILKDRIRRAKDLGMSQTEIVALSHYTRDNVRLLCLPPERREEIRARRRKTTEAIANQELLEANEKLIGQMEKTAADPSTRVKRGRPKRNMDHD